MMALLLAMPEPTLSRALLLAICGYGLALWSMGVFE